MANRIIRSLPRPIRRLVYNGADLIRGRRADELTRDWRAIHDALPGKRSILAGPFRGMAYVEESAGSEFYPKLLGTYELELGACVEAMCAWNPDVVIDIGSAEGYYAVGFAYRLSSCRVFAFDTDPRAWDLLSRLARLNEVSDRVEQGGFCTADALQQRLSAAHRPLVICDCEGGEVDVIDPDAAPALRNAQILVELHEHLVPGLEQTFTERFRSTHQIRSIAVRARELRDLPPGIALTGRQAAFAMEEGRPPTQVWLAMTPS